ncbi:hypothetical protein PM082_014562 [Marasmius tenuissimus]|nr:hypothetical protein PM082_014562 [Marasmius tenuissimus]
MNPNLLPQNTANPSESALNNYGNRNTMYQNCNIQNTQNDPPDPPRSGIEILADHIAPTALHSSDARNARTACLEGTRVGIVKKLTGWVEDPSKKRRVCWATGGAGVGKSAIAQTICETSCRKSQLAASFFFSRNDASRSTLDRFFPTLAHQLATSEPFRSAGLSTLIDNAVRENPGKLRATNLEGQFQSLISQPCAQIDAKKWKTLPKLIVIDGLDECMGGSGTTSASRAQEALLSIINHATSASPLLPFQFMIFSRPERTIRNFFQTTLSHEPVDTRDFNAEADHDIRTYLKKEFATLSDEIPIIGDWPGEEAISQLMHKADGHFIYVVTVMKYITGNNPLPADLRERLDIVLHTEETMSHPDLSDLDQLYHTILRRFGNSDLHTQLLLPLLQLIITPVNKQAGYPEILNHHRRHLMAAVLKIDFRQYSGLLSQLRSVLHVPDDPHSADVSVLHASFSDFLGEGHRSHEFHVQPLPKGSCLNRTCCGLLLILGQQLDQHQRHEQMESENQIPELSSLNSWEIIALCFHCFTNDRPWMKKYYTPSEELPSAAINFDLYGYSNMILDREWAKETFRGCQSMDWKKYLFPYDDYYDLQYHKHCIDPAAKRREFLHALFRMLLKNMIYIQKFYTNLKRNGMDLHHSYFEDDWLVILPKDKKNRKVSLSRLGCIAALGSLPRPEVLTGRPGWLLIKFPQTARDSWSIASPLNVLPHAELERATTKFSGDKFEFCLVGQQQREQFTANFVPTYDEGAKEWKYPPAISTAVWDNLLETLTSTIIEIPQPNGESDSKEVAAPWWLRGLHQIFS